MQRDLAETRADPVPLHLRNAPTPLMKQLGHGGGYRYAHDEPEAYAAGERYLPDEMPDRHYYQPTPRGLERRIGETLARLRSPGSPPRAPARDAAADADATGRAGADAEAAKEQA